MAHFDGSDEEITVGRLTGDLEAFNDLYVQHARDVLAYFSRRVLDPQVALDLTAETFAEALEGRRRIRQSSDEDATRWLYGIARHMLARYFRRGRCQKRALKRLGLQTPTLAVDEFERVEDLAVTDDLRAAVRHVYDRLPVSHREALRLRIVDELPYRTVAAELNISEEAARMRVSRALRLLAVSIARGGEDFP